MHWWWWLVLIWLTHGAALAWFRRYELKFVLVFLLAWPLFALYLLWDFATDSL